MNRYKASAWRAIGQGSLLLLLAACGGGGGDDASTGVPSTPIPDKLGVSVPPSAEAGVAVSMNSTVAATGDLKLEWSFGDGGVDQGATASHVFATAGDFDVTLRATNGAGQSRAEHGRISVSRTARLKDFACTGPSGQGWCDISPVRTGNQLRAVHFVDPLNGWAVGDNGEIEHTADGGATWQPQSSGVAQQLNRVVFKNATEGWAAGTRGLGSSFLLHTVDGGHNWDAVALPKSGSLVFDLLAGGVPRAQIGICTAMSGCNFEFFVTQNGGASWIRGGWSATGGLNNKRPYQLQVEAPGGTVWQVGPGELGSVFKAVDYGLNSTMVLERPTTTAVRLLVFDDQSVLYVAAAPGQSDPSTVSDSTYLLTRNGGATWQALTPGGLPAAGQFGQWLGVASAGGQALVGVGDNFYVSRDYGTTWALSTRKPGAEAKSSGSEGLSEVVPGVLSYHYYDPSYVQWLSTDFGKTWTRTHIQVQVSSRVGGDTLIGMGSAGQIYKSNDGGASWAEIRPAGHTTPPSIGPRLLVAVNPDRLLRVESTGKVSTSTDFGQTWTLLADLPWIGPQKLAFTSPTRGWLHVAQSLFGTTDAGASWTRLTPARLYEVDFLDDRRGWGFEWFDSQMRLVATEDGGQTWEAIPNASPVPWSCFLNERLRFWSPLDGAFFCGGGAFHVTHDGGKSWSARSMGVSDTASMSAITAVDARTVVILTEKHGMVRSTDAGDTWAPVTTLPAGQWNAMQFRKQLGWVVGDAGRVAVTQDGGATWKELARFTDSNLVGVAFIDDRTGWVVTDDGLVFATGTAGL